MSSFFASAGVEGVAGVDGDEGVVLLDVLDGLAGVVGVLDGLVAGVVDVDVELACDVVPVFGDDGVVEVEGVVLLGDEFVVVGLFGELGSPPRAEALAAQPAAAIESTITPKRRKVSISILAC